MSERFFCRKEGKCSTYGDWGKFHRLWFFFCIVHGILQARILEWSAVLFSRGSSNPGLTQVSRIAGDSVPAEPPGKPKNTGVGSLFLLQGIFPTQASNQGLLHCRWILYQLSYQGTPAVWQFISKAFEQGCFKAIVLDVHRAFCVSSSFIYMRKQLETMTGNWLVNHASNC